MDIGRAEKIADIMKSVTGLGKSIKNPLSLKYNAVSESSGQSKLPPAVKGSLMMRVSLYFVAALLVIGLILLGVDQWVTPVFRRVPGGTGYIPVPGIDPSQDYWGSILTVAPIQVGGVASKTNLVTTVIEGQNNYSMTMDVMIDDETTQKIYDSNGALIAQRVFFVLKTGTKNALVNPKLIVELDNFTNTVHITAYDSDNNPQSIVIDNVPIHAVFRIGVSFSPSVMNGYLNGLLVQTRQLVTALQVPQKDDTIFSTGSITGNYAITPGATPSDIAVSGGISVLNLRLFGYTVLPSEMLGRMSDLTSESSFSV